MGVNPLMPFASKEKRNQYQREYKRKQASELKRLKALFVPAKEATKQ
jgi:hypothetical protein